MDMKEYLEQATKKIQEGYPINEQHFQKGDIVWYNRRGKLVEAEVIAISDYRKSCNDPEAGVFYWIKPLDIPWWVPIWDKIRYCFYLYFLQNKRWKPNWRNPGDDVVAGEDIFKTVEEACVVATYYYGED